MKEFVSSRDETREFFKRMKEFIDYLVPLYLKEGKSYLTIAIGCTGGKHRSVVLADMLAGTLDSRMVAARVRHRDISKS